VGLVTAPARTQALQRQHQHVHKAYSMCRPPWPEGWLRATPLLPLPLPPSFMQQHAFSGNALCRAVLSAEGAAGLVLQGLSAPCWCLHLRWGLVASMHATGSATAREPVLRGHGCKAGSADMQCCRPCACGTWWSPGWTLGLSARVMLTIAGSRPRQAGWPLLVLLLPGPGCLCLAWIVKWIVKPAIVFVAACA
jgi:hypothetical protein